MKPKKDKAREIVQQNVRDMIAYCTDLNEHHETAFECFRRKWRARFAVSRFKDGRTERCARRERKPTPIKPRRRAANTPPAWRP